MVKGMIEVVNSYLWPWGVIEFLLVLVILNLAVIEVLFRGAPSEARRPLLFQLVTSALWVLCHAIEISTNNIVIRDIAFKLQLPCFVTVATFYLVFISRYFGSDNYLTRRNIALLCVMPVLALILVMTNGMHHAIWTASTSQGQYLYHLVAHRETGYWVFISYSYVMFILAISILGRKVIRLPEPLRLDAWIIISAACIIGILTVVDLANPHSEVEVPILISAFGLTVGYLAASIGFIFTRTRSVLPFARQTVFDSIANPILVLDNRHRVVDMNQACMKLMSDKVVMSKRQLLENASYIGGINFKNIVEFASSEPQEILWERENGDNLCFEVITSPIVDSVDTTLGKIIVMQDITLHKKNEEMQKRLEQQANLTNRLSTIGELALGIADEINTPLASIIQLSRLLARRDLSDDVKTDIETIYNEARRATVVARSLMVFSSKYVLMKQATKINKIISDVLKIRYYTHKTKRIKVKVAFDVSLPEIVVDYYQIQEVFLNIVLNAEHALSQVRRQRKLNITTEIVGNMIRVSFEDNGPGITSENLDRIFDPFFTTKPVGVGTGLGLSIAYGVVTSHYGRIYAESKLGEGTKFIVELPIDIINEY